MTPVSYARHQFPPAIIQHAVWLYLRFSLSYRDVEDLLVERGVDVSYETVRRWVLKFGGAVRPGISPAPSSHQLAMASGRSGGGDRWQALLSLARRRTPGRGSGLCRSHRDP